MMSKRYGIWLVMAGGLLAWSAIAQSPYADWVGRDIKSLSAQEMDGYLSGDGMGFALAAELNHYPGPRHVLSLAEPLILSQAQITKVRLVEENMTAAAQRLGKMLVAKEAEVDALFARGDADDQTLETLIDAAATLRGKLRLVHLQAHVQMKEILSAAQIQHYDQLRGYHHGTFEHQHHHHQGH